MADINWEPYISTRAHKASQSLPQITIAKDNGRIALNSAACELVPDIYSYKFAEIYCGSIDGKLKKIRLQFTTEKTFKSIPLSRKKYKGNYTNGAVVHSKSLINDIFNAYPNLTRTCHFGVESQIINDNVCLSFDFTDSLID